MEITSDTQGGTVRVVAPTFAMDGKPLPIFLAQSVINWLDENQLDSNKLQDLDLLINGKIWEITARPPVGTPGTIASVIFAKRGSLLIENGICTLFL